MSYELKSTAADYVVSEAAGFRSRDSVTITLNVADGRIEAGTILEAGGNGLIPCATVANASAIALHPIPEVEEDARDVVSVATVRDSEVAGNHLTYPAGATDADKETANAALKALGIVVR